MIVGVPGSGIGGLYYIILGIAMPFCELARTVRGRSSWRRWRMVGVQAGHASGILLALAGGGWLVQAAIGWVVSLGPAFDSPAAAAARGREITEQVTAVGWSWMASLSAVTLLLVILVPAVLALVLALRERMGARKILDVGANRADPKLGFR